MPAELLADRLEMRAHHRPAHALLDRLAAADAGGDLPIGMKADQLAAAKHRLRFFGRARDEILHQHFIGERAARVEFVQRAFEISAVAHEPDAAAGGADRGLDDAGKRMASRSSLRGFHDPRRRLRQAELIEQPAEAGLAVRGAVARKIRQRQPDATLETLPHARKQKSLLMGRQQHVEMPRRQQLLDESAESRPDRPAIPGSDEISGRTARTSQGNRRGIADLDMMARQPQNCDRLARRGAVTLGNKHAERLYGCMDRPCRIIAASGACLANLMPQFSARFRRGSPGSHAAAFMDK